MTQQHKWRIGIIMAHDGVTDFLYKDLKDSILAQSQFKNSSYVIFYYNQKNQTGSVEELQFDKRRQVYDILPHRDSGDYKNLDFYKTKTIIKFLEQIVTQKDDATTVYHYFILTWGHGGGLIYYPWEINKNILEDFGIVDDPHNYMSKKIEESILDYAGLRAGISFDHSDALGPYPFLIPEMFPDHKFSDAIFKEKLQRNNKLIQSKMILYTAFQLNEIFSAGLPKPIDTYFALNCYTQMLETGYELRKSVKMMVASQTTMPLGGINYTAVFAAIENNPLICPEKIAMNIRDNFDIKYSTEPFAGIFNQHYPNFKFNRVSFAANYLEEFDVLLQNNNELADLIKDMFTPGGQQSANKKLISKARYNCRDLTADGISCIIDLTNFINQLDIFLMGHSQHPKLLQIKDCFLIQKNKTNAALKMADNSNYPTPANSGRLQPWRSPLFLSIFAPAFMSSERTRFLLKMYTTMPSDFHTLSHWSKLMPDFYHLLKNP